MRDALELMDSLRIRSQKEKHELSHLYEAKIRNMLTEPHNQTCQRKV